MLDIPLLDVEDEVVDVDDDDDVVVTLRTLSGRS